jgi:uncharacterized protein YbjT (DUF2867 family)
MRNCTLLTGGTGFLGTQIARRLIRNPDRHLVVLVRCPVGHEAAYLERAWWDWPGMSLWIVSDSEREPGSSLRPGPPTSSTPPPTFV